LTDKRKVSLLARRDGTAGANISPWPHWERAALPWVAGRKASTAHDSVV